MATYSEQYVRDFFKEAINDYQELNEEKRNFKIDVKTIISILNTIDDSILECNQFQTLLNTENHLFKEGQRLVIFNKDNNKLETTSIHFVKNNDNLNEPAYSLNPDILNSIILKIEPILKHSEDTPINTIAQKIEENKRKLLSKPPKKRTKKITEEQNQNIENIEKQPKKRGRKPSAEPKIKEPPKKRGRKPKNHSIDAV